MANTKAATKTQLSKGAWVQAWEESERGWGVRPDGYFFYPTEVAAKEHTEKRIKEMRDYEASQGFGPNHVPEEYSRPSGDPRFVAVDASIIADIRKKGFAYRDRFRG